jgi:hypothetical protein
MAATFKNLDLFSSGPFRFAAGKQGQLALPAYLAGGSGAGSVLLGVLEAEVVVTGRLVGLSEVALWQRRDALTAQLTDPPIAGTLIDAGGRTWAGMKLLTVQWGDRTDRGRVWSIEYKCVFRAVA